MKLSYGLAAAAMIVSAPASAANAADDALNAVYAKLAGARAANDVPGMASAFGAEGLLIDARPGPAISGGELAARLQPMAERVSKEGVKIATAYRVERRSVMGDIALDAGYMRQTMTRPDGQTGTRYSRFLVTMRKGSDGRWTIIGDASMPADEAAFASVARTPGLQHDA